MWGRLGSAVKVLSPTASLSPGSTPGTHTVKRELTSTSYHLTSTCVHAHKQKNVKIFTVWVLHKEGFIKKEKKRVGETAQQVKVVAVKLEFYHQSPHGGGRKLSPDFHRQTDRQTHDAHKTPH